MPPFQKIVKALSVCARFARNALLKHDPLFDGCEFCPHLLLRADARLDSPLEADFPVDVVYTWVDGSDPVLAAKRAACLPPKEQQEAVSHGTALHRDNDELRYSLRALEMYAPWVRRIYVITDAQVPTWLDTAHSKIYIVDHTDFIPHEYLPTFNSQVIEAFFHQIPGLGEHYIYFNDDFFLAGPCEKTFFYTGNGLPRLFTDWRPSRRHGYEHPKSPHTCAYGNALRHLRAKGMEPDPAVILAHAPYVQTLSLSRDAYSMYEDAIRRFAGNKFRTRDDLALIPQGIPLFASATKRAVPCDVPHYYIGTRRYDYQAHYDALLRQKSKPCQPPFFCLNDVGGLPGSAWRRDMAAFLEAYYPEPSSFERFGC